MELLSPSGSATVRHGPPRTITDCHRPHRPYLLYLVKHGSCAQIFEKLVRIAENWPKFKKSDIFENGNKVT